jgi:DNA recombination protein RmuC
MTTTTLLTIAIALVAALLTGLAAGWILAGRSSAAADAVRGEGAARTAADLARERAAAAAAQQGWAAERTHLHGVAGGLADSLREQTARAAAAEAELAGDRVRAGADEERLREVFAALSQRALAANSEQLLALAREQLKTVGESAKGDLSGRQQAIEALVAPVREALGRLEAQNAAIEVARQGAYSGLTEQVSGMRALSEGMRAETGQLVAALRSTSVRGRWGEVQLRRVVEVAGMLPHCDFDEQPTVRSEDGALRPDMVIRLAGGKSVVVDSKVPLEAYLTAEAAPLATAGVDRAGRYAEHARAVAGHIRRLGDKAYWSQFAPSPEFVVLFLPGDGLLAAALDGDPTLIETAARADVVLATPSTLIALLRTVAYAWKQEGLARSATEVQELARELYSRLATMGGHFTRLGSSLKSSVEAYNKTVGSLETRVLVTARKMHELHVGEAPVESPAQIDLAPRDPTAAELVASAEDALLDFDRAAQRSARAIG